jgi:hypothetical protein
MIATLRWRPDVAGFAPPAQAGERALRLRRILLSFIYIEGLRRGNEVEQGGANQFTCRALWRRPCGAAVPATIGIDGEAYLT